MHHPLKKGSIPKDQISIGIHALEELLLHAPHKILKVFAVETKERGRKSKIASLCEEKKIPLVWTSFDRLTEMAGTDSHQSFLAHIKPRDFVLLKDFLKDVEDKDEVTLLMLDQIFDPQNLGAILRNCECFGVDAVIFSKNRGSDITSIVSKTSCGASELIPLIRLSNLAEAVTQCQEAGFEAVATVLNPNSHKLNDFRFSKKTLLIMGSEGEGIQPLIQKRADHSIYIPMQGKLQSLNVAQATAVLLYAISAQRN